MTKEEFLEGLRKALFSTGSYSLIDENMRFYSSYIDEEVSKGRSIDEVMEELGDPRLIANSIKAATGYDDVFTGLENTEEPDRYSDFEDEKFTEDIFKDNGGNFKMYNFSGKAAIVAAIAAIAVITAVVVLVVAAIAGIIKVLAPVLIPIIAIGIVFWLIEGFFRK